MRIRKTVGKYNRLSVSFVVDDRWLLEFPVADFNISPSVGPTRTGFAVRGRARNEQTATKFLPHMTDEFCVPPDVFLAANKKNLERVHTAYFRNFALAFS